METHAHTVPSLLTKEGVTTIPRGSTLQVKLLLWKRRALILSDEDIVWPHGNMKD